MTFVLNSLTGNLYGVSRVSVEAVAVLAIGLALVAVPVTRDLGNLERRFDNGFCKSGLVAIMIMYIVFQTALVAFVLFSLGAFKEMSGNSKQFAVLIVTLGQVVFLFVLIEMQK